MGAHPGADAIVDVRGLAGQARHAAILSALDALGPGRALVLVDDRDPRPLVARLETGGTATVRWRYLETGPEAWRVEVTKTVMSRPAAASGAAAMPDALARVPESRRVHLDVREDLRRGGEPFARIMAAVAALAADQALVLRVPFEPLPLYQALGRRGLGHWSECLEAGDWRVWFFRETTAPGSTRPEGTAEPGPTSGLRLDVRGLEPPEPMVRILERLERLPPGQVLEVLHERRPMFLYPQLDDRGFLHETLESEPGLIRILIRRPAGPA